MSRQSELLRKEFILIETDYVIPNKYFKGMSLHRLRFIMPNSAYGIAFEPDKNGQHVYMNERGGLSIEVPIDDPESLYFYTGINVSVLECDIHSVQLNEFKEYITNYGWDWVDICWDTELLTCKELNFVKE